MNRLTELKQKSPSFVRRAYEQTNVGLQPVVGQRLKEALKKKTAPPPKRVILLLLLLSTLFWAAGCEDYCSSSPGYYDPGGYYAANPFDFLDHDRRYYRGPGYSYGGVYYVWEPGYWAFRTGGSPPRGPGIAGGNGALPNRGQLLWIHGRYIAQGY